MKQRGDYLIVCDSCGMQIWRSKAKKRWDGVMVCQQDFETRHISERKIPIIKGEGKGVKDARPEVTETFTRIVPQSDNYKKNKIWGDTGNAIWGGVGDPSIWSE